VGKTIAAMRVLKQRQMFALSADSVRDMLRGILKPFDSPALFAIQELAQHESRMATFLHKNPQQVLKMQNDESAIIWKSVNELIISYLEDGQDVLVEGIEILPRLIKEASYDFRAVFLGNSSSEHADNMVEYARTHSHDWMHKYARDSIDAWASFGHLFSEFIKVEARANELPYVEINDAHFEQSLVEVERILLA